MRPSPEFTSRGAVLKSVRCFDLLGRNASKATDKMRTVNFLGALGPTDSLASPTCTPRVLWV
jgi:hypothetical protein